MRFLLHATEHPTLIDSLQKAGHRVVGPADIGLSDDADPSAIIKAAHVAQLDVVTIDRDFAQFARTQPVKLDRSMIYFQLTGGELEYADAVERLFTRFKRLKPGHLYTVTETQVKTQQMKQA